MRIAKMSMMVGAGLLSAALIATPVAQAATTAAQAAAAMLVKSDIPSVYGTPTGYAFSNQYATQVLTGCYTATGAPSFAQLAPPTQYKSTVPNITGSTYVDVTEWVFQYPTAKAAANAYSTFSSNIAKCTGTVQATPAPGVSESMTYSHGALKGQPVPGVWVLGSTVPTSTGGANAATAALLNFGSYVVTTQTGSAIVQTGIAIGGQSQVSPAQVAAAQQLAITLTQRWQG
jgi:hypothetical protein